MKIKFSGCEAVIAGTKEEIKRFSECFIEPLHGGKCPHVRIISCVVGLEEELWTEKERDELADKLIEDTLMRYKEENGKETK